MELVRSRTLPMLARVGSALRARPFVGACTAATVKTSAADVMVQTVIEGRQLNEIDQRCAAPSTLHQRLRPHVREAGPLCVLGG